VNHDRKRQRAIALIGTGGIALTVASSCSSSCGWGLSSTTADDIYTIAGNLLDVHALYRLRQAQGVVRLADKHGALRLDLACRRALEIGDPSYKTVKGILLAGTERDGIIELAPPDAPAHLHGPDVLFSYLTIEASR
jgi:hypothetical protein